MAEYYYFIIYGRVCIITCIPKIYGRVLLYYNYVLLYYNLYPEHMAEYYFIITCIPKVWQSITLL